MSSNAKSAAGIYAPFKALLVC